MRIRNIFIALLLPVISLAAFSQEASSSSFSLETDDENGPKLKLTGSLTGIFSMGFMEEDQAALKRSTELAPGTAPGIYYGVEEGKADAGKNGYFTEMDFRMLFNPVPAMELYIKFLAQYRPGSPYLPMQLEENSAKTFSNFTVDAAYGRVNAVKALGFSDFPLDVWLKAGKFDTLPSQFNRITRHSSERATIMGSMRTTNDYALQLEAAYPVSGTKTVSLGFTTHPKLNDAIAVLYDEDSTMISGEIPHGDPNYGTAEIPLYLAVKMEELSLPFGTLSAEFIYAYNVMNIYSGNNYGLDLGIKVPVNDSISVFAGPSVVLFGKNVDPVAGVAIYGKSDYFSLYQNNGYHYDQTISTSWDANTASHRQSLRAGLEAGVKYDNIIPDLSAAFNAGFIFSQMAHIYRNTLSLPSLSADLRVSWQDRYFIGGGIFLGTLADTEWETKDDVDPSKDNMRHKFTLAENLGFEVFGGLQFKNSRFILGYNVNKGLSMNNYIECIPTSQMKYRQKDTIGSDGLFERGGLFTKLIISW